MEYHSGGHIKFMSKGRTCQTTGHLITWFIHQSYKRLKQTPFSLRSFDKKTPITHKWSDMRVRPHCESSQYLTRNGPRIVSTYHKRRNENVICSNECILVEYALQSLILTRFAPTRFVLILITIVSSLLARINFKCITDFVFIRDNIFLPFHLSLSHRSKLKFQKSYEFSKHVEYVFGCSKIITVYAFRSNHGTFTWICLVEYLE